MGGCQSKVYPNFIENIIAETECPYDYRGEVAFIHGQSPQPLVQAGKTYRSMGVLSVYLTNPTFTNVRVSRCRFFANGHLRIVTKVLGDRDGVTYNLNVIIQEQRCLSLEDAIRTTRSATEFNTSRYRYSVESFEDSLEDASSEICGTSSED
jgi:hypothetical protein